MWGITNAYTAPQRYSNPDYVSTPVTYYNPFVKLLVTGVAPDWDNLYLYVGGKIVTVTEALGKSAVPLLPEDLYAWFIEECF
jgi:hypothetical protein